MNGRELLIVALVVRRRGGGLLACRVDDAHRREDRALHLARGREPALDLPRERAVDHADELGRHGRIDRGHRGDGLVRREQEGLLLGAPAVDALAGDERVEQRAHGEEVGASVDAVELTLGLLGGHVRGRAEREAERLVALVANLLLAGDAEVEQLHGAARREEDVRGLEVAVNDASAVARGEAVEDALGDVERALGRDGLAGAPPVVAHGLAFEQLHDEEGLVSLGRVVVQHADARRVPDLVRHVRLSKEPLHDRGIARERLVHDLERGPLPVTVRGRVDRGDAAYTEEGVEAPLAAQRRADPGSGILLLGARRDGIGHDMFCWKAGAYPHSFA